MSEAVVEELRLLHWLLIWNLGQIDLSLGGRRGQEEEGESEVEGSGENEGSGGMEELEERMEEVE